MIETTVWGSVTGKQSIGVLLLGTAVWAVSVGWELVAVAVMFNYFLWMLTYDHFSC